jgi:Ser/Thr protein kinase RdoA (MazF antagonist)
MGGSVQVPVEVAERAAAAAAGQLGRDGRPKLLRNGMNVVFRVDDTVVRVSSPDVDVARQVALASWLADQGVPVLCPMAGPVAVEGVEVTVWEFIDGEACIDYGQLGGAIARLHRLDRTAVAEHVALPWCGDASWLDLDANLDAAATAGVVTDEDIALLRSAARDLAGWQEAARDEGLVVCHGDVHPQNVLMRGDELVILDWDSICLGPAAWDHAALLTWAERWGGDPGDYDAFAVGCGADLRESPLAQLLARVRLVAPTINMIIRGARSSRDAEEARLRMKYWRGEPSPPTWTAQ